jgi:hypothetical protein
MKKLVFALMILSALVSCQKEIDVTVPQQSGGPAGGGGTGGGGSTGSNSYNPITVGTWWKWKDSASGTFITDTVTNITKTISGILFNAVKASNSTDTGWMASPSPNYYSASKGVSPNTGASYDLLIHFLNDTASVGYNWQYNAGQGNGFTAYLKTTIMERNISMTVQGVTYNNVIHTHQDLSYDILGTIMSFGSYEYYVAKGIGIIKIRSDLGIAGSPTTKGCTDLVAYHIN